jgi:hypothetical protein
MTDRNPACARAAMSADRIWPVVMNVKRLAPDLSVAGQIRSADMAALAQAGFRSVARTGPGRSDSSTPKAAASPSETWPDTTGR